ncbi:MAG: class I SAM-dependent methyltransferase [Lachnospiraceae bacterium]
MIRDIRIDGGNGFDWGKASLDYAKYRDVYPKAFFDKIVGEKLCVGEQKVLDVGTGTGVIPRNLYEYGACFTGTDISKEQVAMAKELSVKGGMDIDFRCVATEDIDFDDNSFDVISACQCFFYFKHDAVAPKFYRLLMPGGKLLILYMAWLPFEDDIAAGSEKLVLKYNPKWSGKEETRHNIHIPEEYLDYFDVKSEEVYDVLVPFTRESWNGRMRACRGIGASLSEKDVEAFDEEHLEMLERNAPAEFDVLHYVGMTVLSSKKRYE